MEETWRRLRGPLLQGKGHIIYKHKNIYTSVTQSGVVLNGVIKSKYRYQNAKREGRGVAGKPHCKGMQKTREVMEKKRVHNHMDKLTLTCQFGIQFSSLGGIEKEFWNVIISIHTDTKEGVLY